MNVTAIVPIKELATSKKRLSLILSSEKRRALSEAMLEDVLTALKSSSIHNVLVVSPDSAAKDVASNYGYSYFSPKETGLNEALEEAIKWCMKKKVDAVLILPADIPLVSANDINEIVRLGSDNSTVVLSPSLDGGTNAFLLNPPNLVSLCFGKESFFVHVKKAIDKGITVKFYSSKEIAMDIDSETDIQEMFKVDGACLSKKVLSGHNY